MYSIDKENVERRKKEFLENNPVSTTVERSILEHINDSIKHSDGMRTAPIELSRFADNNVNFKENVDKAELFAYKYLHFLGYNVEPLGAGNAKVILIIDNKPALSDKEFLVKQKSKKKPNK